ADTAQDSVPAKPIEYMRTTIRPHVTNHQEGDQAEPAPSGHPPFEFNLEDTPGPQRLRLMPHEGMRFDTLRFILHNELAYPGKTHRHMCIAELTIYNPLPPERAR
ncbi:MAG TPA: hypothetical protein PLB73_13865, partial [Leptospiraceae bacterium]|nr:hypothetical protein [Leptospiraceae bacterium]